MTDSVSVPTTSEGAARTPGGPSPRPTIVPRRPPPWRDVKVLGWIIQLVVVAAVAAVVLWLWENLRTNTSRQNLKINFDYLRQPAGFPIPSNTEFRQTQPVKAALVEAFQNTLRLAVTGLVLATVLGVLLGIARLSQNFLVRTASRAYVEFVRNVPLLLILTLSYIALVLQLFPAPAKSWIWQPLTERNVKFALAIVVVLVAAALANRVASRRDSEGTGTSVRRIAIVVGVAVAAVIAIFTVIPSWTTSPESTTLMIANVRGTSTAWITSGTIVTLLAIAIVVVVTWLAGKLAQLRADRAGGRSFRLPVMLVAALVSGVVVWAAFGIDVSTPQKSGLRTAGGITMTPEYLAALVALVVYTSSHIAEIVRGSIQAVHKGQREASEALALSGAQRMWHVILPQAMRIAVPAIGNQYLNLVKNSSLAAAISYAELTHITRLSVANRSPAIPSFVLLLGIYLVLSLVLAAITNTYNRRLAIVER